MYEYEYIYGDCLIELCMCSAKDISIFYQKKILRLVKSAYISLGGFRCDNKTKLNR